MYAGHAYPQAPALPNMASKQAPSKSKLEEKVEDDADLPEHETKLCIFPYLMSVFKVSDALNAC